MHKDIEKLVNSIKNLRPKGKTLFIGIDGRGGTGKTTLALLLKLKFPKAKVITTDDFWNEKILKIDENLLREKILEPISKGLPATYLEFDGKKREPRTVQPGGMIIIEGVYSIHSSIEKFYDYKIWVESSLGMVNNRIKIRDNGLKESWEKVHRPNETKYIEEDNPKERADLVIDNEEIKEEISNIGDLWKKVIQIKDSNS